MADIFISYSRKDREQIARLVDALTAEGYQVWWDRNIRAGESFDELIEGTLERVSCVVGVWSQYSVKSSWVRAESGWAMELKKFVSVRIDGTARLPLRFYNVHTASFVDWDGSPDAPEFRALVRDIAVLAGDPKHVKPAVDPPGDSTKESVFASRPPAPEPPTHLRDDLRDGGQGPEMVFIPAGRFRMGSTAAKVGAREYDQPQHLVKIPAGFWLGRHPVTFDEYDPFCAATGRESPSDWGWGRGNRPVINITWWDAAAYCAWLSEQTGETYRLPTEAE